MAVEAVTDVVGDRLDVVPHQLTSTAQLPILNDVHHLATEFDTGSSAMAALARVIADGDIETLFQPIVDLDTGCVVAFEALSRGPHGPLRAPTALFAAARHGSLLTMLDGLCRERAIRSAIDAGLDDPLTLFINVEPEVIESSQFADLVEVVRAAGRFDVVLEITERAISTRPAELLATVSQLRAAGWRIALDDIGADEMSLAFMPLLRPDILKLDLRLVHARPGPAVIEIMHAVNVYAETSGALILAEGIEDDEQLAMARTLGARLGQGWMFGRPQKTLETAYPPAALPLSPQPPAMSRRSPFECLPDHTHLRVADKSLLIEFSKFLEREAQRLGPTAVVLSSFQEARFFTPRTARRYRDLAANVGFVAAMATDVATEPVPGVRGVALHPEDPLGGEWDVVVLSPHFAAALLARDLGDDGPDRLRKFEFALTYDRGTVATAAVSLASRITTDTCEEVSLPAAAVAADGRAAARPIRMVGEMTETMVRRALDASTNGVAIADMTQPGQPLVYVNPAFERLAGFRASEVLGRNCRFLQGHGTDRLAVAAIRDALTDGREIVQTLLNFRGAERTPWWNEIHLSPVFDELGRLTHYVGVQNDVTQRVHAQRELEAERARSASYLAELEYAALRDPLTGLLNRRALLTELEQALTAAEHDETALAVLFVDIDGFKQVNDRYGHRAGDVLLAELAARLQDACRHGDPVSRYGGDEFVTVVSGLRPVSAAADVQRVIDALLAAVSQPIEIVDGVRIGVGVSVGCAIYPDDAREAGELLQIADSAMYTVKIRRPMDNTNPTYPPVGAATGTGSDSGDTGDTVASSRSSAPSRSSRHDAAVRISSRSRG